MSRPKIIIVYSTLYIEFPDIKFSVNSVNEIITAVLVINTVNAPDSITIKILSEGIEESEVLGYSQVTVFEQIKIVFFRKVRSFLVLNEMVYFLGVITGSVKISYKHEIY